MYKTQKSKTGKFNSYYCQGGETSGGQTIIFLHGSGPGANSESNWKNILPALTDRYHVLAPDMYGFGYTDHPDEPPKSFWEWTQARVDQVLELMDHLGIEKAGLVGNSMGGYVSLNLVMAAPERFTKVLLMGSAGGEMTPTPELSRMIGFYRNPTYESLRNLTKWFVYDDRTLGDELEAVLKERYKMIMRPEVKKSYLSNMFPTAPGEGLIPPSALRRMKQPFLLLHGVEDRFVPMDSSLSLLRHLPNAQAHFFKQCGHWIQIEKRESFLNMLIRFIDDRL